ncbi:MAG: dephospho-CoA kinase [Clostridia bacterium]|nr:dephospho-CoA kinase [Clostridia bacterium]MBQ4602934.1 dephospho-CoA kinase [Clostridia bacterium]
MLIVGLTGASGSGKGYLCSLLSDKDICIIDTDRVYHKMISSPSACVEALVSAFGEEIRDKKGGIDRAVLGSIVFSSKEKLELLNSIAHRFIREKCNEIIEKCGSKIVILDAPVLFESGFDDMCDLTVGVVASRETRIERIIKRDGISREKAYTRIENQHSDDWFRENCDIVIENDGGELKCKAQELKARLMRLYGEKEKKKK